MAQYYFVPKPLAERFPALGRAAQSLEAALLKGLFWCVQRLRPEQATRVAGALFATVGPWTQKARKADTNLAIAFPDRDAAWRKRTVKEVFRSLGMAAAELLKLEQLWQERGRRIAFQGRHRAALSLYGEPNSMTPTSPNAACCTLRV